MTMNRRTIAKLLAASALGLNGRHATAQTGEMARVVLGFPAGSSIDALARRVAEKLAPGYAKTTIVENRVGGGGQVAVASLKGTAADGSAILLTPMSILGVYPHTYKRLPYDPFADLTPVSNGVTFDYGFAVGPAVPAAIKTVPEFMDWCKANPDKASIGSPATGSTLHFTDIVLGRASGVDVTHVGYRGSQAAIQDIIGGQLPALIGPLGEFLRHLPAGRVRLLASSGARRSRFTPDVATLAEQGYKDMVFSEWFGFFLPGRAAADVVSRLNEALRSALSGGDVASGLAAFALEPTPSSPAALAQLLRTDFERWGPIVKTIGFTAEN